MQINEHRAHGAHDENVSQHIGISWDPTYDNDVGRVIPDGRPRHVIAQPRVREGKGGHWVVDGTLDKP